VLECRHRPISMVAGIGGGREEPAPGILSDAWPAPRAAIEDNVIVCPTSWRKDDRRDLATQTLLVGISITPRSPQSKWEPQQGMQPQLEQGKPLDRCDSLIAEGRVVLTPPESNRVALRHLADGRALWTTEPGRRNLCGVRPQGKVIVIGKQGVSPRPGRWQLAWAAPISFPDEKSAQRTRVHAGATIISPLQCTDRPIEPERRGISRQSRSNREVGRGNLVFFQGRADLSRS